MTVAINAETLQLSADMTTLTFVAADLEFSCHRVTDAFAEKNNKTVGETFSHRRYASLAKALSGKYRNQMDQPLGQFLVQLKRGGDETYKRFLNRYGDSVYCTFQLGRSELTKRKGVYAFACQGQLVYIGRSRDPFLKRFNQGYGKIHPKNCFIDGQATNRHLNALIAANASSVKVFLCPLDSDSDIIALEQVLIRTYRPEWNLALAGA